MAPDTTVQFPVNERVLCFHGPVIYEAKIVKTDVFDETNTPTGFFGPHYFVHYKGWKATFVSSPHSLSRTSNRRLERAACILTFSFVI